MIPWIEILRKDSNPNGSLMFRETEVDDQPGQRVILQRWIQEILGKQRWSTGI